MARWMGPGSGQFGNSPFSSIDVKRLTCVLDDIDVQERIVAR